MTPSRTASLSVKDKKRVFNLFGNHISKGQIRYLSAGHLDILERNRSGVGFDEAVTGKRFIDGFSSAGCFNVGRGNPRIIQALEQGLKTHDMGSTGLLSSHKIEFANKLADHAPGDLNKILFAGSGADAIEGALKLARGATGRNVIISMDKAYHGHSGFSLSANGKDYYKTLFLPLMPGFALAPFGDLGAIEHLADEHVAAIILEPIQGEGGIHVATDEYLKGLRTLCDQHGILLIFDEIQTGFGRTGRLWGSQHSNVIPDIMVVAKSIGGGVYPNGAVVYRDMDILNCFMDTHPDFHRSSGGGSDLGCMISSAVLDYLLENETWKNAETMGNRLKDGLKSLQQKYPKIIQDVRGRGMMLGIEYKEEYMGVLMADCLARNGMFAVYSGNAPQVMRFQLPITATQEEIDETLQIIARAIKLMRLYLAIFFPISWHSLGKKLLNNQDLLVGVNNLLRLLEFKR